MRSLTLTAKKRTQILATMFAAYGQAGDEKRLAAYSMALVDVPEELLMRACHLLLLENKFLPSVSEIVQACRELVGEATGNRTKTWAEAWAEIRHKMHTSFLYEETEWSTPEIKMAVEAYGWRNLCAAQAKDWTTVESQVRRFYDNACQRNLQKTDRDYVLKNIKGAELIGALPGQKIIGLEAGRKKT